MKILQTNPNLHKSIQRWGCYYRSILAMAEEFTQKELIREQIQMGYYILRRGVMGDDCFVKHPEYILTYGLQMLGASRCKGLYIGWAELQNRQPFFKSGYEKSDMSFMAKKGLTKNGNPHFRLALPNGHVIFDPHGSKPEIAKEIGERYFAIKNI